MARGLALLQDAGGGREGGRRDEEKHKYEDCIDL